MNTITVSVQRVDLHRVVRGIDVAILVADKTVGHLTEGEDVEGHIADLGLHLRELLQKVDSINAFRDLGCAVVNYRKR